MVVFACVLWVAVQRRVRRSAVKRCGQPSKNGARTGICWTSLIRQVPITICRVGTKLFEAEILFPLVGHAAQHASELQRRTEVRFSDFELFVYPEIARRKAR